MLGICQARKFDFVNLDLRLLVAGEIKIITSGEITEFERNSRLNLVKKILYDPDVYECQPMK